MNRIYQGKVTKVEIPTGKNSWPSRVQPLEIKKGLRLRPIPVQESRFSSQPGLIADRLKKMGLRKPRMEVIVSTFRQKRLGSSQPIVAARLVLIRALHNPYHRPSQHHE